VAETPKVMGPDALLRQKVKQKRWREGYEEGVATTHRAAPAAAFVASATPVEMLGQFSQCAARQGSGKTLSSGFLHYFAPCLSRCTASSASVPGRALHPAQGVCFFLYSWCYFCSLGVISVFLVLSIACDMIARDSAVIMHLYY